MNVRSFTSLTTTDLEIQLDNNRQAVLNDVRIHNGSCRLKRMIGEGSFGVAFEAEDIKEKKVICIKIDHCTLQSRRSTLRSEFQVYCNLRNSIHIPQVHWLDEYKGHCVMGMQLLGNSIQELCYQCGGVLRPLTVLKLGLQMLDAVEYVHGCGYVHRDLKPENFLIGLDANRDRVFLTDFGLARFWKDPTSGNHYALKSANFAGTVKFSSLKTDMGFSQSRRDDVESLAYVMIGLIRGQLPWWNVAHYNKKQCISKSYNIKSSLPLEKLCENCPRLFVAFLTYVRSLEFEQMPDYNYLRRLLSEPLANRQRPVVFDWDDKNFRPALFSLSNETFAN